MGVGKTSQARRFLCTVTGPSGRGVRGVRAYPSLVGKAGSSAQGCSSLKAYGQTGHGQPQTRQNRGQTRQLVRMKGNNMKKSGKKFIFQVAAYRKVILLKIDLKMDHF